MSNSSLVTVRVPAHPSNYTKGRNTAITDVTIHHMAGILSAEACGNIFARAGRNGSAHYGIGNSGEVGQYVDEADTAWTNSNWASNCRSVTIETSNSATGGEWPVSDAAYDTLIKLVADIAKRNNLGTLVAGKNLTWHSMFAPTTCPGDFLRARVEEIARKANEINGGSPAPAPTPVPSGDFKLGDHVLPINYVDYNGTPLAKTRDYYTISELNGDRAVLTSGGVVYAAVNTNNLRKVDAPAPAPAPTPAPASFKVGDVVVPTRLVDYNGTPLVQYDPTYTISEINGDRAVLMARGAVWAAMNTKDIRKA
jgi:hypothetical protein